MKTFKHSGTLGDLVYSLQLVKKLGGGHYQVALENIERCVARYGYRPEDVDPQHRGRFTARDYEMLMPLIQRQPYINSVGTWTPAMPEPDVDLDHYRSVLYRSFEGNILKAYHLAFGVPFTDADYQDIWLEADPIEVAPIVVTRSARYHPPNGDAGWQAIIDTGMLNEGAVFVGTPTEHTKFTEQFNIEMPYRPVNDFLELAGIVAGSELVVCNQGFTYSLAVGLGKSAILEINKLVPQQYNECYFPRENIQYF